MYQYYDQEVVTTIVTYTSPGLPDHNVTMIVTPKVLEVATQYYGCDSMVGVELENGGSAGTTASHWER
jgi:hypothetical protein